MTTGAADIDPAQVFGIGISPLRKEDWPLVRGEGVFIADFKRPGTVHAFVVRSPLANART
jgi:CO/xanthine dehydrogenase Mo-binding subunit